MPRGPSGLIDAPSAPPAATAAPACVAVVVHYHDAASTRRCVQSLLAQEPRPFVVVVDNDAPDGSGRQVAADHRDLPAVLVLRALHNGGFGAGCNLGIDLALQRWPDLAHVLLLNPDAELAGGALAELLATARRHPAAGIVGCAIDDGHGGTWFGNGRIPRWTLSGFHVAPPAAAEHPAGFVTGACMLLRGDLLRRGLRFDERYFLYCEDADLCEEVRRHGGELWINQRARASHRAGGSQPGARVLGEFTAGRLYWLTRGKALFAASRLPWPQRACFFLLAVVAKPLLGLLLARSGRFLRPYFAGLRDGWRAARTPRRPALPAAPPRNL